MFVTLATEGTITTTIENESQTFTPQVGTIALIPAGAECASSGTGAMASYILMVPKETLSFAAAERTQAGASPLARLKGEDLVMLRLCRGLARHITDGSVDDPIAWYELTDAVVQRMIDTHLSAPPVATRGRLCPRTLKRVIDCIHANLNTPLTVNELANAAQQSWSHFPRLFRRSTGLSPYQYVIKARLAAALKLLRSKNMTIAEVAAETGFADQGHLCRWARRSYGTSPSQLMTRLRRMDPQADAGVHRSRC